MISTKKILTVGLLAVAMPQLADAQALKNVKAPANLPPADYTGVQYVDNKGCIFVRTGRLGDVNWVPRIDQSRKHMCSASYTPTFRTEVVKADEPKPATVVAKTAETKPATAAPSQDANLDRGNVAYKGDVIKPVGAPDTSMVQAKEATTITAPAIPKPAPARPQVSDAAKAAKAAAQNTAKIKRAAEIAEQEMISAKMKADAIAAKNADEKRKAAQMAQALKDAIATDKADANAKAQIAQKIAEDKEGRATQRATAKAARAAAAAERKAALAATRSAAKAAREAKRQAALDARAADKAAKAAKAAKPVVSKEVAKVKPAKPANPIKPAKVVKPAKIAKVVKKPVAVAKAPKVKVATKAAPVFKSGYYVDLGSSFTANKAQAIQKRLLASGYRVQTQTSGSKVKVFAGPFRTASNARVAFYQAQTEGYKSAKVVKK